MAALVQTYPQQTRTAAMLQTRPSSTSGGMMSGGHSHSNNQYMGGPQAPRSAYPTGYRGSAAPAQSYTFSGTPNTNQATQWQHYGAYRTNSSPAVPVSQNYDQSMNYRHVSNQSPNNMAYSQSFGIGHSGSRDDSAIQTARHITPAPRPQSYLGTGPQPSFTQGAPTKNAPDRYRRPAAQPAYHGRSQSSTLPSSMSMGNINQVYNGPNSMMASAPNLSSTLQSMGPGVSMDDMHLHRRSSPDETRKMRRRSMHTMETADYPRPILKAGDATRPGSAGKSADKDAKLSRPTTNSTMHSRTGSSDSVSSTRSGHSRPSSATNRNVSVPTGNPSLLASDDAATIKHDQPKLVNIPPRGSSSDATKRTLNPSPLSRPARMANDSTEDSPSSTSAAAMASSGAAGSNLDSPAAKQLAAINQKGGKAKTKTSRLRRAFSFGSAADFRAAAGPQVEVLDKTEPSKLHKDPSPDEAYNAEQARIVEAQEAAGIGNNIYGGRFFGSTDNLSISSTASSASIMIRKMGRGMKKSTRSLVGLFRPKSVIGVPASDALAPEASEAAVSMITVEAETQRVNVTADPHEANGGTGFPHLERNSMDAAHVPQIPAERLGSSGTDNSNARKSIVGGDRERAEVLAAVRKGILKRTSNQSMRPADASPDLTLPEIPAIADSLSSSAPSTPNDEAQGHRRTSSVAIGTEDYFMAALRLRQDTKSAPGTPHGSTGKRNATFSPRLIFHDTWPSQEYDRRGEVATCNRLTPMLAQQIKEELNTFKMEMEVHENSKIYTHFF